MVSSALNRLAPIDFTRYIDRLTERFTGREWLFDQIDRWLKQGNEQFYLLTGEPGVGKSAIAAKLTQIRSDIAAYHFCRAGDVETVRPGRVLRSLAAQLGKTLPHYGEALAKTIDPIHLRIDVNINVESLSNSQVTGIYIENLKESDPRDELEILLRAPLAALPDLYAEHNEPLPTLKVLLIDSLDEAVTTTGRDNMATLLAALSQVDGLPSWIRFILTARPDLRVLQQFELMKLYKLEELLAQNLEDIEQYVQNRVQELVVEPELNFQIRLEQAQLSAEALVHEVKELSKGNFLYTRLVVDGIGSGELSLKNLSALPKTLNEVYQRFLRHRCPFRKWINRYQPILGTLTVTQEAISQEQLVKFTGINAEQIQDAIAILQQFLDEVENDEGQKLYAIFHQSLREYLLDRKHNHDFWCDALELHEAVVNAYKNNIASWNDVIWNEADSYGLLHLTKHLYLQIEVTKTRNKTSDIEQLHQNLYTFICKPLMLAKADRFKSDQPFSEDVKLLIEVARSAENLTQDFRGNLILSTLVFRAGLATPDLIGIWAISGDLERAIGYSSLLSNSIDQCKAHVLIGEFLGEVGRQQDALQAIDESLRKITNIEFTDNVEKFKAKKLLITIIHICLRFQFKEKLLNILKISERFGEDAVEIFAEISQAQVSLHDVAGVHETLSSLRKLYEDSLGGIRSRTLEKLVNILISYDEYHFLGLLLDIIKSIQDPIQKGKIVGEIATVLCKKKDINELFKVLEFFRTLDEDSSIEAFPKILKAFAELGEIDLAIELNKGQKIAYAFAGIFPTIEIISAFLSKGNFEHALLEYKNIYYDAEKLKALDIISQALVKSKKPEKNNFIFSEIEKFKSEPFNKAKVLGNISNTFREVENIDLAVHCVDQALELIRENMKPGTYSEVSAADVLSTIISALVPLEDLGRLIEVEVLAETMLDGMPMENGLTRGDGDSKGRVFSALVIAYFRIGKEDKIQQLLTLIDSMGSIPKNKTLELISRSLIKENEFFMASRIAKMRNLDSIEGDDVLYEITQAAIQVGEYHQALMAAHEIPNRFAIYYKNGERFHPEDHLVQVINSIAKIGELDWALREVDKLEDQECWIRAIYLVSLLLVKNGEQDRAKCVTNEALKKLDESDINKYHRIKSLNSIAKAFLQLGEIGITKNILDQLFKDINNLQDEYYLTDAFSEISYTFAELGDVQKINTILAICDKAQGLTNRAKALSKISISLALVDENVSLKKIISDYFVTQVNHPNVLEVLIQSLPSIWKKRREKSNDNGWISTLGRSFGFAIKSSVDEYKRSKILNYMVDAIQHVDNQKGRLDLLCSLLPVLINEEKSRTTSKVIKLISSDLESIKRFPWEPEVLCNLAGSLILLGKAQDASKLVNSALSKAESHAYPGYRAFYLSKISELLARLGEEDRIPEIAVKVLENTDWNYCTVGWSKEAKIRVSLALTRIGRVDVLEHIVLMADKIDDEELNSDILCGMAASLSPNRLNQLDFLVMSIKSFKEEKYTLKVLNALIKSLARMEKKDELNKLLIVAQEISSKNEKIRAFSELTRHLTKMNCYQDALSIWKERLQPTYLKSPQDVFTLLEESTLLIAQIDKGRILKSLYEIIIELREW